MKILFILSIFLSIGASIDPGNPPEKRYTDNTMPKKDMDLEIARVVISEMDGVDTSNSRCTAYIADAARHCWNGDRRNEFRRNAFKFYNKCFTKQEKPSLTQIQHKIKEVMKIQAAQYNVTIC